MAGFDSMYTGISGMNAYQSWIDMISNNIANVDTTGFKGQMMTFADMFYQNQTFPSAPNSTSGGVDGQQLGFGVKVDSVDTLFGQGGLDTTGVNTNLAMNGDGFFILNNLQGSAIPTYTRDGDFQLNSNGVLYDPASGLAVQGWEANSQGVIQGGATGNITIPVGLSMKGTATGAGTKVGPTGDNVFDVAMGGDLDQSQWQNAYLTTVGSNATASPYTVTTTLYDSLGNAHKAEITYIPDATGATPATASAAAGTGAGLVSGLTMSNPAWATAENITMTVNATGTSATISDGTNTQTISSAGGTVTIDGSTFTVAAFGAANAGQVATYTITPGSNGLPATVENTAGQAVTPATRWQVVLTFTDGTQFTGITQGGTASATGAVTADATTATTSSGTIGYAYFDQNGQFINSSSIETGAAGWSINANTKNLATGLLDFHTANTTPSTAQGNLANVTTWGGGVNNAASPALPGTIAFGFWQNTSLSGAYTANVDSQNGFAAGTLSNFTIGTDGTIMGAFTNGQNQVLGQVAVARFANEDGLERVGDNQFEQTANSGLAQVGVAGTGTYGTIQSGALEESNVSLSQEFTNLIIAQRAFEANTRGITTADQNLQDIINLRASEN